MIYGTPRAIAPIVLPLQMDHRESKDHRESREKKERKEIQAQKDLLGLKVHREIQAKMERKASKEFKEFRACRAILGLRVILAHREFKENLPCWTIATKLWDPCVSLTGLPLQTSFLSPWPLARVMFG
jgi:hypothetical protein